jgi:ADP-ribosylglycohydrolase
MQTDFPKFCNEKSFGVKELPKFKHLLHGNIFDIEEKDIHSTGYVIHSLEASIWCLFKTKGYAEATLLAANLGEDSDTTAAITGGLAGLVYGYESIPEKWLILLARNEDIKDLGERMAAFL